MIRDLFDAKAVVVNYPQALLRNALKQLLRQSQRQLAKSFISGPIGKRDKNS